MLNRMFLSLPISFLAFSLASEALAAACAANASVIGIERVAAFAMSLGFSNLPRMTNDILGDLDLVVDHAKMEHITAGANATLMVDLHSGLDSPVNKFPNVAMNADVFAIQTDFAVAVTIFAASKNMARSFQIGSRTGNFVVNDSRWRSVWPLRRIDREKFTPPFGLLGMSIAESIRGMLPSAPIELANADRRIAGRHDDLQIGHCV